MSVLLTYHSGFKSISTFMDLHFCLVVKSYSQKQPENTKHETELKSADR